MKKHIILFVVGVMVAVLGLYFAELFASVFNGLSNDSGRIVGMLAYNCTVMVICTGVIVTKIYEKPHE